MVVKHWTASPIARLASPHSQYRSLALILTQERHYSAFQACLRLILNWWLNLRMCCPSRLPPGYYQQSSAIESVGLVANRFHDAFNAVCNVLLELSRGYPGSPQR